MPFGGRPFDQFAASLQLPPDEVAVQRGSSPGAAARTVATSAFQPASPPSVTSAFSKSAVSDDIPGSSANRVASTFASHAAR